MLNFFLTKFIAVCKNKDAQRQKKKNVINLPIELIEYFFFLAWLNLFCVPIILFTYKIHQLKEK